MMPPGGFESEQLQNPTALFLLLVLQVIIIYNDLLVEYYTIRVIVLVKFIAYSNIQSHLREQDLWLEYQFLLIVQPWYQ